MSTTEELLHFRSRGMRGTVKVSLPALEKLLLVQAKLPGGLQLVVTRGLEETSWAFKSFHRARRMIGSALFLCIFPFRANEIKEIFQPNGHDEDGRHIDVSIEFNGKILNFLPLGAFTPLFLLRKRKAKYDQVLRLVSEELANAGFKIHSNEIEAAQIHCDYPSSITTNP